MSLTLPFVALIDTSVFLRRLGERPDDIDSPACIDFCDRMAKGNRTVCVAAPTITEVTRFKGAPLPRVPGIVVVAFDEPAATLLGMKMPSRALKDWRDTVKDRGLDHIKYDALIVGCALRVPNATFVGLDRAQLALAQHVGLKAHHPRDFAVDEGSRRSAEQRSLLE